MCGNFERQCSGKTDYGVFGCCICRDIGISLETGGRSNRDDAALLALKHSRQHCACRMDHTHQIDSKHPLEQGAVGFQEGRTLGSTGIGHQDIDSTMSCGSLVKTALRACFIGRIEDEIVRRFSRHNDRLQMTLGSSRDGDAGTCAGEGFGNGTSNALAATRDHGMSPIKRSSCIKRHHRLRPANCFNPKIIRPQGFQLSCRK